MPEELLKLFWPLFLCTYIYTVEIIHFLTKHHDHFHTFLKIINQNFSWLFIVLENYHQCPTECQVAEMAWPSSAVWGQSTRSRILVEEWQDRVMQELVVRIQASIWTVKIWGHRPIARNGVCQWVVLEKQAVAEGGSPVERQNAENRKHKLRLKEN